MIRIGGFSIPINRYGIRYILREFVSTLIFLVILFVSAGTLEWINGWICFALILIYQAANIIILHRINPELINKRGTVIQENTKLFDKIFVVIFIPLAYGVPLIAGLDAVRFQWTSMHVLLSYMGGILFILASVFGVWAMAVNSHFEMTVFIEGEQHRVCTSGPYRFVRHPGYSAEILSLISSSFLLGSWWSLIPAGILSFVFIIRTTLEDKTLQEELPGYSEYAKKTRYRLIPFIW